MEQTDMIAKNYVQLQT